MSIFLVKVVHTLVFFLLSGCVLYILFCALANRFPRKVFAAILLIVLEGVALVINGWECPLSTLARRLGAEHTQVADIFLPRWFADRLFGICTPLFLVSTALLLARWLWDRRVRRKGYDLTTRREPTR